MDSTDCEDTIIGNARVEEEDVQSCCTIMPKEEDQDIDQMSAIFPCISCYATFLNREDCREHMREHARNRTLKCRYCEEYQSTMKQLLHHLRTHRSGIANCIVAKSKVVRTQKSPRKRKWQSETKPGTETLETITEEEKRSRGRKKGSCVYNRKCNECGEEFSSTTTLKNHKKLHNAGKLLYSCWYCGYRSDFPAAIGKHLKKKHENLKTLFKCSICKYVAIRISLLKAHVTLNKHYYN